MFVLVTMWFFQNDIIYASAVPPNSRENVALPSQYGLESFEDVHIKTADKFVIRGYFIKRGSEEETKKADVVLLLHDYSGNMGHRLPIAKALYDTLKCNVFMLSYRGYGLSQGYTTEAGIKKDILAALGFLRSNPLTASSRIVIYGQSLGGAVAIDSVAEFQSEFSGLIVENVFKSLPEMFADTMPYVRWAKILVSDKWDSVKKLKQITKVPILFLLGEKDDYIPPEHTKELFEISRSYSNTKVEFCSFKDGRHNNTCLQEGYFERINKWWNENITTSDRYIQTNYFNKMTLKPVDEKSSIDSKSKSE
ncbi:hypothetical protein BB560_005084 [Smittium megazygosporum]|uniref:Peptidase S9 prolyl oligopeptidase catalytic domain-containing protein n=1 Tax=Smittium megazygosporum TaxID=133381 RepID=A0A2T9Z7G9_9FUNG|nr:hypothetical protein BB560_005084 [Smittium megazygosporum]